MDQVLASLLAWVVLNTPYGSPPRLPELEFQSGEAFRERACPANVSCAARGFYEDGTGRIVIHEAYRHLADVQQRALLVHELVHYLQDLSGRYGGEKTCEVWLEREREAFRIQLRYMARETGDFNLHFRVPRLSVRKCQEVEQGNTRDAPT